MALPGANVFTNQRVLPCFRAKKGKIMAEVIKISLVLAGETNVVEYHRLLPASYFNVQHCDLFSKEIDSLRDEAKRKNPKLKKFKEYIRIAAIDSETGKVLGTLDP
jgi:hypothetical protein